LFAAIAGCGLGITDPGSASPPPVLEGGPGASLPEAGEFPDAAAIVDAPYDAFGCGAAFATDPLNCGRCEHSCLGGTCNAGKCEAVVLATNEVNACAVAVDATNVYFALHGSGMIRKVPIAGGAAKDVFPTMKAPHDLLFDSDRLYWGDQERVGFVGLSGAVMDASAFSSNVGTFGARAIAKTAIGVYSLSQDTVTYWGRGMNVLPGTVGISGGQAAITVSATHVYWSAGGKIHTAVLGANSELPTIFDVAPRSMTIFNGYLYWTSGASVSRASLSITPLVAELLVDGEGVPDAIAVDASGVYWMNFGSSNLKRTELTGGPSTILLGGQPQLDIPPLPRVIALDDKAIYVVSSMANTVTKLAKP